MDLKANLQVRTGLEATQISYLVLFQAETSTEREKSIGGTCEQGPSHVSGELPTKPSKVKFGSAYSNLHPQIYNKDL